MARIYGSSVILREFRKEDFEAVRRWTVDAGTTRYLGARYVSPETVEQTEARFFSFCSGDAAGEHLVICDAFSYDYLGQIELTSIDRFTRQAELAIVVAPEYRGRGIASEAVRLMLRHAFYDLGLNRVWLKVFAENTAAVALYERCGFTKEGTLREDAWLSGRFRDTVFYAMLRADFEKISPSDAI